MTPKVHPLIQPDPLAELWRALSDPTRRQILDALRQAPLSTGQLADAFPQSRYAIMKHLDVLVAAGLVITTREGRVRWNRLNPVPLRALYERWVQPYEALWAESAIRLKTAAERTHTETAMTSSTLNAAAHPSATILTVALEVPIAAPREHVWRMLTDDVASWWPRDFYASERPKAMRFEAHLGGRLYEESEGGGGVLWYTVFAVEPGHSVDLVGHLAQRFGGPSQSMLRLSLREQGSQTVLELQDAVVGNVGARSASSLDDGWRALFERGLKPHAESTAARR